MLGGGEAGATWRWSNERAALLKGGRVDRPGNGARRDRRRPIADGVIAAVGSVVETARGRGHRRAGCVVAPGFVDLHTHLREPGREDEETIATASAAAAAGGYTAICTMPNTDPVCDTVVDRREGLGTGTRGRARRRRASPERSVADSTGREDGRHRRDGELGRTSHDVHRRRPRSSGLAVRSPHDGVPRGLRRDLRGALRGRSAGGRAGRCTRASARRRSGYAAFRRRPRS